LKSAFEELVAKLKPSGGKQNKEGKSEQASMADDPYINLFDVLNSKITGSIAVPVQCRIGNGLALVDWNPNDGSAFIDRINSLKDQPDDSLGLNNQKTQNYRADGAGMDPMVESVLKALDSEGLNPGTPTMKPRGF
jgi:hypothetical protein